MKQFSLTIIFAFTFCLITLSQKLTLTDLTNLCSKKNWEDVNQTLLNKGWTYYDSEKGSTYNYNTITWSYIKDYYDDKAQGWFYLYTYEGFPNKISYSVFNKESYSLIQNSISSAGFKLIKSDIEDNEVISTYGNTSYTLKISTEKRKDNDYSSRSLTAYSITLIKKAGIYDEDNGKKTDYYFGGNVKAKYTLLNGKINGEFIAYHTNEKIKRVGNYDNGVESGLFKEYDESGNIEAEYSMSKGELNGSLKTYYPNGKLKKSGSYLNGKEQGNFAEYDENGVKQAEYVMANDMKNGVLKIYKDGKINILKTFRDDVKNGQIIEYYYDDETGKLKFKQVGEYLNDKKNGTWKLLFVEDDNTERPLTIVNYLEDSKNGPFQEISGDSLIIGSYNYDELDGEYRVYLDVIKMIFGGLIKTDTASLNLITEGNYASGLETGLWKNYDFTKTLRSEGRYANGAKNGEWRYYYSDFIDKEKGDLPYSNQLYLIQNYSDGKLDGKCIRYSYLTEEEFLCSEIDPKKDPLDTCKRYIFEKVLETSFYKNGKLNGPFEVRDSLNEIIAKGNFQDDLKEGEWLESYDYDDENELKYAVYQKGNYIKNKRNGKWIQYYSMGKSQEIFNYKNGELHGEYVSYNNMNRPIEKKQFNNGELTELITYDSLGINPKKQYQIYFVTNNSYKCRMTDFYEDKTSASQEYYVNKEKEINHNFFELIFLISIDQKLAGITSGYKDGEYKLFNSNNQPIVTGNFYKESKNGLWTFYYYDQKIKIESNFTSSGATDEKYLFLNGDLFSGDFVYYDADNGIKEVRKIKDGLRNGKTIYFDIDTKKKIKKESYKNGILND
jgi:antitoxin component YwqK of YwqJK toxin-antitoxin module